MIKPDMKNTSPNPYFYRHKFNRHKLLSSCSQKLLNACFQCIYLFHHGPVTGTLMGQHRSMNHSRGSTNLGAGICMCLTENP